MRHLLPLSAQVALAACAARAAAAPPPTPEVMIVLDASSSMQFVPEVDAFPSGCAWTAGVAPAVDPALQGGDAGAGSAVTRLHHALDHLAGRVEGTRACRAYSPAERRSASDPSAAFVMGEDGDFPHFRALCRSEGAAAPNVPCGADHGRARGARDPDNPGLLSPVNISEDGFIPEAAGRVRFGLMVSDSNPKAADTPQRRAAMRDWSFGDERVRVPALPAADLNNGQQRRADGLVNVTAPSAALAASYAPGLTSPARAPWHDGAPYGVSSYTHSSYLASFAGLEVNLGVQGEESPAGRLIHPWLGEALNPLRPLEDGDAALTAAHNAWVREELRRVVPTGPTPLSAMLADLKRYYQSRPADACRARAALLVTDGAESPYMPLRPCQNDGDCAAAPFRGACRVTRQGAWVHHERLSATAAQACQQGSCAKVCAYPDGAPYAAALESARDIYTQLGVPVFVATVGLPRAEDFNDQPSAMPPALAYAYELARAGAPDLGAREGTPGLYRVEDLSGALSAEELIRRVTTRQRVTRVETQPLALGVTPSDAPWGEAPEEGLRQLRLATSAYSPALDTRYYGEVWEARMGCDGAPLPRAGLKQLGELRFEERVAAQVSRPAFTARLDAPEQGARAVVDAAGALFKADGAADGPDAQLYLPGLTAEQLKGVGLQARGYFGARGVSGGVAQRRAFGATRRGDVVGLTPPSFVEGSTRHERPSLAAVTGDDGLTHVFRAFDGLALFSFVPRTSWRLWAARREASEVRVDGPLAVADLIPCRAVSGAGTPACPVGRVVETRPVVVGAVGAVGAEVFGFEVPFSAEALRAEAPALSSWPQGAAMWSLTPEGAGGNPLGRAVSRPALTHVRLGEQVRAVAVVGCGDDPSAGEQPLPLGAGRCLLLIDPFTGAVLYAVNAATHPGRLTYPVVGSPAVYPDDLNAPAEQVYFGDRAGQVWRLDLKGGDTRDWELARVWPLAEGAPPELARGVGFAVVERPSVSLAQNRDRVLVFGTTGPRLSAPPPGERLAGAGYVVSLRERRGVSAQGVAVTEVSANWVMDLAEGEEVTGAPKVRDSVLYVTTARPSSAQVCGQATAREGRLYGVHYTRVLPGAYVDPFGARSLRVVPMLPRYTEEGERADDGLSVVLPPGRTASGFALVPTPSCSPELGAVTELVMNLTEEGAG
ncbi:MAG: hypothetical protein FJ138_10250, partial [Deltaproteobacteria bacterium]|nr:hypothetical protein [Deltaproteobacteria bacterium]